jgi:hypothetical protein
VTLRRSSPRAGARWSVLIGTVVAMTVLIGTVALAAHSIGLSGSDFEIDASHCTTVKNKEVCSDGANLTVDDANKIDWRTVDAIVQPDAPSGSGDDSFTEGTKEDTAVPAISTGSIPPNKSDLLTFGVYLEDTGTDKFLHMFWHRVQEPSGTTNMDFEFNQSEVLTANGVTPVRTAGDLLVQYDLSQGGTNPQLFLSVWVDTGTPAVVCEASNTVPCWGKRINLSDASLAAGSINSSPIAAADSIVALGYGDQTQLGAMSVRTFGEATIDFGEITDPTQCVSFGSAYLKSRSSDSFTAALKDFIAPVPTDISNCGGLTIEKVTVGGYGQFDYTSEELPDATFSLTTTAPGAAGADSVEYTGLLAGTYDATEVVPSGWTLDSIVCVGTEDYSGDTATGLLTVTIQPDDDVTCTFTNSAKASLTIVKELYDGTAGTTFNFTSGQFDPFGLTPTDTGAAGADSETFDDLDTGTYDVAETVPAGWNLRSATCDNEDDPSAITLGAGDDVTCTFVNEVERGAIKITKTRKHAADGPGDHDHAGVDFTITGGELAADTTVTTDANGEACLDGLLYTDYTVTETVPAGYVADDDEQDVTVSVESSCGDGNEATVSFSNMPLTNITVSVDSQIDGGTASVISCTDSEGNIYGGSTGANGDGSLTVNDLLPTDPTVTLTCTITVDP